MAAVFAPSPANLDNASLKSISASSLAHLFDFFDPLDMKNDGHQFGTNEGSKEPNWASTESPVKPPSAENKNLKLSKPASLELSPRKSKSSSLAGSPTKSGLKPEPKEKVPFATIERANWLKRAFSTRFSTWAFDKKGDLSTPGSPDSKIMETLPTLQVSGIDTLSSASNNGTPVAIKKRSASVSVNKKTNFRPTRSRSLAGVRLTSVFLSKDSLLAKQAPPAPENLETSVFSPHNHDPAQSDFPSIKDVEDMSNGKAQYSTLPADWDNYKDEALKSSGAPSPKPRTKWAEWRKSRRNELKGLKGKLKSSLASGKRRSKGLRVRFFAAEGGAEKKEGKVVSTNDEVMETVSEAE